MDVIVVDAPAPNIIVTLRVQAISLPAEHRLPSDPSASEPRSACAKACPCVSGGVADSEGQHCLPGSGRPRAFPSPPKNGPFGRTRDER
jgi:hypothetical protein